jgi:hypothetical protein
MRTEVSVLYIDATNQIFSSRLELKEKGIHGEQINNRQANKLIREGLYTKVGNYSFGNEQDIRLLDGKMLLFVGPIKKFVVCGLKIA